MKRISRKTIEQNKGELEKAVKFVLLFALIAIASYLLLNYTPLKRFFGTMAAESSQTFLNALGTPSQIGLLENGNYYIETQDLLAELNEACAALVEIAVLAGIVFASFEKSLKERMRGFVLGLVLLLLFNPLRISLSVLFLDPLVHDVLFRVMLVITIIVFYAWWYYGKRVFSRRLWGAGVRNRY